MSASAAVAEITGVGARFEWYPVGMSGTTSMKVGNKGRVVIPAEIRARHGWAEGTVLVVFERQDGTTELISRDRLLARVQGSSPNGTSVVDELIAERHAASRLEDAGEG